MAASQKIQNFMPTVAKTAVVRWPGTAERRVRSAIWVSHGTYPKAAIANNLGKARIRHALPLGLDRMRLQQVAESIKVANFAEQGSQRHNTEPNPNTVHNTTEHRHNLRAKKWWEGEDKENRDWDDPPPR